jgi:glyoxalase family protein
VAYATPDVATRLAGLRAAGITAVETERFGAPVWLFADPDGLQLELETGPEGFAGATLWLADPDPTAYLLAEVFGYEPGGELREDGGTRLRLSVAGDAPGRVIDLWRPDRPQAARRGAGTVHHIAFRARDRDHQDTLADRARALGLQVTERRDRNYFEAVYFREPGGVLFEIATDPPGFTVDESAETLGCALKLPPQFESDRARITASLPPL